MTNSNFIFSGTSHPKLAETIAKESGLTLGKVSIERFPDHEIGVRILEHVQGRDVFVLQTIAQHPNSYLMELLIMTDALRREGARSVTALIPYFGYSRQDRQDQAGQPITAKLIAKLLETSGVDRVIAIDLHSPQIEGFFDIPIENVSSNPVFENAMRNELSESSVIVTPDAGSIRLAHHYADHFNLNFALVDKRRIDGTTVESGPLIGNVRDCDVLIVDDICSTGRTLCKAADVCRKNGAGRVTAFITHAMFDFEAVQESAIDRFYICDTIDQERFQGNERVEIVSVASVISKAIFRGVE